MEETTTVAVIGAGPAGLAVSACLKRAGLDFVLLEKGHEVAPSWRRHYERLHLHTVKAYSSLPFQPFPRAFPRYVPRDLVIRYFAAYAAGFDLQPRFGETVRQIRRDNGRWLVEATSTRLRSRHVVIATGNNAEPIVPDIVGLDTFRGKVLHSADYANAVPFTGQSVLVIGMGNTGAEIALDLAEAGAHPTISVRSGVHIVPRELFGVPIQLVGMFATKVLPQRANDRLFPIVLDLALGNLEKHGIRRPKQGLLEQIASASRIPVIDVGTVRAISSGAIRVEPDIRRMTQTGVLFNDGTEVELDAVILATGYRPSYPKFLQADVQPVGSGVNERASAQHLYLIGFYNPVTGLLREISREAIRVADDIMAVERKPHR